MMNDVPFNFVIDCTDAALAAYLQIDAEDPGVFNRGDMTWCLRTYLILSKRTSLPVSCSNHVIKGAINLVHSDQLLQLKGDAGAFIVCAQADFPSRRWAQYHIVQNKNQVTSNASYIPHWMQPGLIKRNMERLGVTRVGYAGQVWNGNLAGTENSWQQLFAPYNIDFVTLSSNEWHNLQDIDILIGIRSFNKNPHNTKPPSKLLNAWYSGIPFVGGYDSAYKQVGTPGEDYLLARSPEEAVAAVVRLQADPKLFARLVHNGHERIVRYTHDYIAQIWERVLTGPVLKRYQKWQSRPKYEQQRFAFLLALSMLEHQSKQVIKRWIRKADKFKSYKIISAFK